MRLAVHYYRLMQGSGRQVGWPEEDETAVAATAVAATAVLQDLK